MKDMVAIGICAVLLMALIALTSAKRSGRLIHDVLVDIEHRDDNYFIDQPEVVSLLNAQNTDYVLGLSLEKVDLKLLETRLKANAFVQQAQVCHDLKGNLQVSITESKPIARIYSAGGEDKYIDEFGTLLPFNAKHTARVPLVETDAGELWEHDLNENEIGIKLFELLSYIRQHEFWKAQIAHLLLKKNGEIEMMPQVTRQKIVFGQPEEIEDKFKRLEIFYKQILPNRGWNTYALVNLKFKNQIICE